MPSINRIGTQTSDFQRLLDDTRLLNHAGKGRDFKDKKQSAPYNRWVGGTSVYARENRPWASLARETADDNEGDCTVAPTGC